MWRLNIFAVLLVYWGGHKPLTGEGISEADECVNSGRGLMNVTHSTDLSRQKKKILILTPSLDSITPVYITKREQNRSCYVFAGMLLSGLGQEGEGNMRTTLRPMSCCAICSRITALVLTSALIFKTFKRTKSVMQNKQDSPFKTRGVACTVI